MFWIRKGFLRKICPKIRPTRTFPPAKDSAFKVELTNSSMTEENLLVWTRQDIFTFSAKYECFSWEEKKAKYWHFDLHSFWLKRESENMMMSSGFKNFTTSVTQSLARESASHFGLLWKWDQTLTSALKSIWKYWQEIYYKANHHAL